MFDLISIGDAVIDTFIPLTDAEVHDNQLCLRYGDKIPVGPSVSLVAGNAANNAVGSARLKLKVAHYVNVGGDSDGKRIRDHLKEEGVDTRYVVVNDNLPSNHHIVLNYQGERTILIYHQPWKYQLPELDKTRWVYLTSLSPSYLETNLVDQVLNYLQRSGARLVFNPGTFQIKQGLKKNAKLLSLAELFVINLEESKLLLGYQEQQNVPIKKLLKGLADFGPRMVVITDGGEGSYGFDGEEYYHLGVFPAKLLEMTGSGDAFATGTLAGLAHGQPLALAMRWGAVNGASVVEQIGPQAGLLSYHQMQERLKTHPRIIAKKI